MDRVLSMAGSPSEYAVGPGTVAEPDFPATMSLLLGRCDSDQDRLARRLDLSGEYVDRQDAVDVLGGDGVLPGASRQRDATENDP